MQDPSGKLSAHCFHNSCGGRGWQEFKERIGKPDGDHYDPPMEKKRSRKRNRPASAASNGEAPQPNGAYDAQADPASGDEDKKVKEEADDPHRIGRTWLFSCATRRDATMPPDSEPIGNAAAFFRSSFWMWEWSQWRQVPEPDMRAMVTQFAKTMLDEEFAGSGEEVPKVTPALVSAILGAIGGDCLVPSDTPMPSWRGTNPGVRSWLAFRNGILDIDGLLAGAAHPLLPHSPQWFSTVCLPFDFDPQARCPRWERVLARNLADDPAKIRLLQQWSGYLLTPDTSLQRFLLMVGDGANGKSVVLAVLHAMLGDDNVSTVPLELFGNRFRLIGTLGKLANLIAEVGEIDRTEEGLLKAFVVGDPIEFEQKFKQPFKARPTARIVMATNTPPQFSDKSDGIWRRQLLLPFTIQIPEAEQVKGMDKPEYWIASGEMPGVINWRWRGCTTCAGKGTSSSRRPAARRRTSCARTATRRVGS